MNTGASLHSAGRLLPFLAPYKRGLILATLCVVASAALQVASPKIEGLITTRLQLDVQAAVARM